MPGFSHYFWRRIGGNEDPLRKKVKYRYLFFYTKGTLTNFCSKKVNAPAYSPRKHWNGVVHEKFEESIFWLSGDAFFADLEVLLNFFSCSQKINYLTLRSPYRRRTHISSTMAIRLDLELRNVLQRILGDLSPPKKNGWNFTFWLWFSYFLCILLRYAPQYMSLGHGVVS